MKVHMQTICMSKKTLDLFCLSFNLEDSLFYNGWQLFPYLMDVFYLIVAWILIPFYFLLIHVILILIYTCVSMYYIYIIVFICIVCMCIYVCIHIYSQSSLFMNSVFVNSPTC